MKTKHFFLRITVVAFLTLIFLGISYIFYPTPRTFWNLWHNKDFSEVASISENFNKTALLSNELSCWQVISRCGIEMIFTSKLSLAEFKTKVASLGFTNKYDADIDETGLTWILVGEGKVTYKGEQYTVAKPLHLRGDQFKTEAWGYKLISTGGKNISIDYFSLPKEPIALDGTLLEGGVIRITRLTRDR